MPSSGLYRLRAGVLPPGTCWSTPQAMLELFAAHMTVSVPDSESQFNMGTATPAADRRGIPWFRLDGSGRPVGWYFFYGGEWRKVTRGLHGEIRMYEGTDADFDDTGKGKIGTEVDGWALCNGKNGTVDFRDKFIVVAQVRTGGLWKTNLTGETTSTGGEAMHNLAFTDLPAVVDAAGTKRTEYVQCFAEAAVVNQGPKTKTLPQEPLPPPPYYALAFIKWIDYV